MSTAKKITAIERPPVICIMGHIDHGKSTLLDYIRKTNIVENEHGGITQHINAYEVEHETSNGSHRRITFIDTPGHAAFSGVRECGTAAADIAVLVVSAEDGVKPQTLEAYRCIENAGIPYVVAINKIDKPTANIEKTKISLAENGIYLEGYGGSISYVPISAKTGDGISELLDLLVLTGEVAGLSGTKDTLAEGVIIETKRDPKKGISATLVIKNGTIRSGQFVLSGKSFAPTRMIEDFRGKKITEATFSSPIQLIGWDSIPETGEMWRVYDNKKDLEKALGEAQINKGMNTAQPETFGDKKVVPIIIKADTVGSIEAVKKELSRLSHERIALRTVHASIGDVTESDVKYASGSSEALIVGFNVRVDSQAQALIERLGIHHALFNIIYKLTEWVDAELIARTPKIIVEESVGRAKILKFFSASRDRQIVGGKVIDRSITLGHRVKIVRRESVIGEGVIRELQQAKIKTDSVNEGFEFGAMIEAKLELAPGDVIEDFVLTEK